MDIEELILSSLLNLKDYTRKCFPYIKQEYFENNNNRHLFELVKTYINDYKKRPTKAALNIELDKLDNINEERYTELSNAIETICSNQAKEEVGELSIDWLVDNTEQYCKKRSIYNGITECISIIDGSNTKYKEDALPDILKDALSVSFESHIGHDFFEDYEERFKYYMTVENKVETPLSVLNKVMNGGPPIKTLNVFVAPTGVGKTLFLSDHAMFSLMQGYNVAYFTMEISDKEISRRGDAKLLDVPIHNVEMMASDSYRNKIQQLKQKTSGQLIVEEYPPGTVSASTFRYCLEEMQIKKDFVPDIIFVDYLGIVASDRVRMTDNMYQYFKMVAEELRGLAIEYNVPLWTAAQSNRDGQNASDFDLNEVAESHGISKTSDFIIGGIETAELAKMGQLRFKQLKNRYGDVNNPRSFIVGADKAKMTLYDLDTTTAGAGNQQQDGPALNNNDNNDNKTKLKV